VGNADLSLTSPLSGGRRGRVKRKKVGGGDRDKENND